MTRTERILEQGHALVRAIDALEAVEPTGWLERSQVWLLLQAYRRLRAIVGAALDWLAEKILSASQEIGKDRPAVWLSEN
jgi:hypothetical protein